MTKPMTKPYADTKVEIDDELAEAALDAVTLAALRMAKPATKAMVRALGRDIDGLGPPGTGRFYLVLEVPTGPLDEVLTDAVSSGCIGLVPSS
jgi:hypothetical protein